MKVSLEPISQENRGICLESENDEEANVLRSLWFQPVRTVAFARQTNGEISLVIAPHNRESQMVNNGETEG